MKYNMNYFELNDVLYAYPSEDELALLEFIQNKWDFSKHRLTYLETEDIRYISEQEALQITGGLNPLIILQEFDSKTEIVRGIIDEQNPKTR